MKGYLRGYYGYKNFGDELLFFGVVKRLFSKYPLTKLFVEAENVEWMEDRIRDNYQGLLTEKQLNIIKVVGAKQHINKYITHLLNIFWRGKYKKTFKFFGWGEVFSDEKKFPHDGWNVPILFNHSVRKWQFILLWWIGKIRKSSTQKLYEYVLPKAEKIVVRDRDSFTIAKKLNPETVLYQDFAQETIMSAEFRIQNSENKKQNSEWKYILININKQMLNEEHIRKIVDFCQQYPEHKKIFFPCDMQDDKYCFPNIKKHIPDLEIYDRTKHSLQNSLSLFYHADAGIGTRLHFLLPLKLYNKPIEVLLYADKVNKLIYPKIS